LTTYYNSGDAIRGDRIAIEARDIDNPIVKKGSHTHKIQSAKIRGSAYCVIEQPLRSTSALKLKAV
jgi:hypothetical protein